MKKINLTIVMILALLFGSTNGWAAAAEPEGDGLVTKTAVNKYAIQAIDLICRDDPELHKVMSRFYLDPSEIDHPLTSITTGGSTYNVWGDYKDVPMSVADIDAREIAFLGTFLAGTEIEGETKYLHVERIEEWIPFKRESSVNPAIFNELETTYPFLQFYDDLSFIAGDDKDKADAGLKIPARSAVEGSFPEEGFVASGAAMTRLLNKETGEVAVINGLIEEPQHYEYFSKILRRLQGDSISDQVDILTSSLLFGPDEIALGQLLIDLGYTEVRVQAFPQITEMTRIYRSEEIGETLTVPELEAYNKANDEYFEAYSAWEKEYYRLHEAGGTTYEHEEARPKHPEYPDVPDIIQTALISADGSVKVFLDRGSSHTSTYYTPNLPKDDGRAWYDFSTLNPLGEAAAASSAENA